jgi:hypothetical protein
VIISESRGLSISEKHYTPFLLVMKDAWWRIDHFIT